MHVLFRPFAAMALLCLAPAAQVPAPNTSPSRQELNVLYAGVLETDRASRWMQFLTGHFKEAGAIPLETLSTGTAAGYDVVVVDAPSPFTADGGFNMPRAPKLDASYTTPTILIGAAGGGLINARRGQLKLDWL